MEITSNSLQELINKKAKDRAWKLVHELVETCKKNGLDKVGGEYKNDEYEREFKNIFNLSMSVAGNPFTLLYEAKTKQFIEEETKSFVSKVEELHSQADTLLNITDNLNY